MRGIPAYFNHGRWVVDCPRPYCGSAALAEESTMFRCSECHHVAGVVWSEDRHVIEELMAARPDPATRNWTPAETMQQLVEENEAHDL